MQLYLVETGNFKLDGGAMFGVVPKNIWQRTNPADDSNRIDLAARSLLIEEGDRLILVDCGMGDKQSDSFFSHYHMWGPHSLNGSLKALGFSPDDITDVFLTHLHFDHVGGGVRWNASRAGYELAFKNARYWSNRSHWGWATAPNAREKASFLSENILPIEASGQLYFTDDRPAEVARFPFEILYVDGHTEKQMLPILRYKGTALAYVADLIPTAGHIPLPYVMGYDTRPLLTLSEKAAFLERAASEDILLLFEHDAHNELVSVKPTEKGVRLNEVFEFNAYFS
jgi:glyoxylase-like metal-dependent hydrolase (beta-lactamase superfamily II)